VGAVDEFALLLGEFDPPELRLHHLICCPCLQVRQAAGRARRHALLTQGIGHGTNRLLSTGFANVALGV
jgi:hypothetical protein